MTTLTAEMLEIMMTRLAEQTYNANKGLIEGLLKHADFGYQSKPKNLTENLVKRIDPLTDMTKFVEWQQRFLNAVTSPTTF